jgi:hypothetical protein
MIRVVVDLVCSGILSIPEAKSRARTGENIAWQLRLVLYQIIAMILSVKCVSLGQGVFVAKWLKLPSQQPRISRNQRPRPVIADGSDLGS